MKGDMLVCGCQPEGSLNESDINNTSLKGSFLPVWPERRGFGRLLEKPVLPLLPTQTAELPALTKTTFTHSWSNNE